MPNDDLQRAPVARLHPLQTTLQRGLPVAVSLIALLCLWEGLRLAFAIPEQRLPPLRALLETSLIRTQGGFGPPLITQMLLNAWATLQVAAGGFVLGGLLGCGLALLFFRAPILERGLLPFVVGSQMVPILALAPMVVVGLGRAGASPWLARIVVAAYLTFFPVTVGMLRGLRAAPPDSQALMRSYAAGPWQTIWKLRLPTALPFLFTALKIAASASVIGAIVAELPSGARQGIGVMILTAAQSYNSRPPALFLAIIIAGLLGIFCYGLVALAERLILGRLHLYQRPEEQ